MKAIKKVGPIAEFLPSLEELRSTQLIKAACLELIRGSTAVPIATRLSVNLSQLQELFLREWPKINYYKRSKNLSSRMKVIEDVYSKLSKLPLLDIDYSSLEHRVLEIWGPQFDFPDQLRAALDRLIGVAENEPTKLTILSSENDRIFKLTHYYSEGLYSDAQFRLLILEQFDKERVYFERLKLKFDSSEGA